MIAALGIFQLGIHDAHGEEVARCMAFVTLVIGNLGLVLTSRSMTSSAFRVLTRPNWALAFVVVVTMTALCQRRLDSNPAGRSKSRPVPSWWDAVQRAPIGDLCTASAAFLVSSL